MLFNWYHTEFTISIVLFPDDLIELGRVVSSYGIKGLLKIYPYSKDKSSLLSVYDWWVLPCKCQSYHCVCQSNFINYKILSSRIYNDYILSKISGVVNREEAEMFRGNRIYISKSLFPKIENDEYYWVDLIGCKFYGELEDGSSIFIGEVSDVFDNGAHSILKIIKNHNTGSSLNKKEILVPFVKHYINKVDLIDRIILSSWLIEY
ncbi:16S rRNA processing protein RimM [Candidatus Kinetoplastibacterium desouzaii TCC079E]|uniref:Ribosome maturation factor RimM n=1 Tax=Candidatus Kinetoplastidibacterium desouzai TCC079E TaxID=1208919 RepID=M1LUG4_9PROT|nr:ribosome maturation factor RimM [Candidatus Kinetoplastibacterium desouzaii]AGF46949.1 16S rRNA processing protein RimM [Candidatus Kinetoplastibacterium desouzaii TCC079E]